MYIPAKAPKQKHPVIDFSQGRTVKKFTRVKHSDVINRRAYFALHRAVATAHLQGLELNVLTSITWTLQGLETDADIQKASAKWRALLQKYLRSKMKPWGLVGVAFIWVHERGLRRGMHSHLQVHIPFGMLHAYRKWAERALKRVTGRPPFDGEVKGQRERAIKIEEIKPRRSGQPRIDAQWAVFNYLTKGISVATATHLARQPHSPYQLEKFNALTFGDEGGMVGTRCGASQDLGPNALSRWCEAHCKDEEASRLWDRKDLRFDDTYLDRGWEYRHRTQVNRSLQTLDV